MATRPQDQKEEGPGNPDPARKNEVPEIELDDDMSSDGKPGLDEPELRPAPAKPELSEPLEPAG